MIPLGISGIGIVWFLSAKVMMGLQESLIPNDAIYSGATRIGNILMVIPLFFPSVGAGFIITNCLLWLVKSARKTFEKEAKGVKGASFAKAMRDLTKFTIFSIAVVTPISFIGSQSYFYIKGDGIYLNSTFHKSIKHYNWNEIKEIRPVAVLSG